MHHCVPSLAVSPRGHCRATAARSRRWTGRQRLDSLTWWNGYPNTGKRGALRTPWVRLNLSGKGSMNQDRRPNLGWLLSVSWFIGCPPLSVRLPNVVSESDTVGLHLLWCTMNRYTVNIFQNQRKSHLRTCCLPRSAVHTGSRGSGKSRDGLQRSTCCSPAVQMSSLRYA